MILCVLLTANAWAKDDAATKGIGDSLKKAGDSVGSGMEKVGKAAAPEVHKAESWLDGVFNKSSKKSDKANK